MPTESTDTQSSQLPSDLEKRLNVIENEPGHDGTSTQEPEISNTIRRRSSVATKPGLTFKDLPSVINPPIPESLPTTPGLELSQQMFENSFTAGSKDSQLPTQQRPKLVKNETTKSFTRLLRRNSDSEEPIIDENVMSFHNPPKNKYRVMGTSFWAFTLGMNDGVLGAILPKIEDYYNVSYGVVSLIWLGNAIGYVCIALTAHHLDNLFGRQKTATASCAFFAIAFAIMCTGTKFPVICVGFFFAGIGGGVGLSQFNIFLSKLKNPSKFLGIFHGCYGIGAFLSPLIGTAMVNKGGVKWHFYYFIPLAFILCNMVFMYWAYQNCDEDLKKWEYIENVHDVETPPAVQESNTEMDYLERAEVKPPINDNEDKHNFKAAMADIRTWLVCSFIFFYQGSEVSMGGWVVTFLLDYRGGDEESVGYVSSGFWGGVTVGRFLLTQFLATTFGVRRSILVLAIIIALLDIVAWLVPNTIASGIFASFIGLFIGPLYPMMVSLVTRILPRKIRFCALTLGTAFGSSGGSVVPFAVGMSSQFVGTYVLHPIFLACYTLLIISWIALPNIERKSAIKNTWQRIW